MAKLLFFKELTSDFERQTLKKKQWAKKTLLRDESDLSVECLIVIQ